MDHDAGVTSRDAAARAMKPAEREPGGGNSNTARKALRALYFSAAGPEVEYLLTNAVIDEPSYGRASRSTRTRLVDHLKHAGSRGRQRCLR